MGVQGRASISPVALQAQVDHPLEPLVDLRAFRDLSYVPVKGIYVTSYACRQARVCWRTMLAIADQTEINAFVIDVKDDLGSWSYDCRRALAKSLGLVDAAYPDIDGSDRHAAAARHHPHRPGGVLPGHRAGRSRPDLAVQSKQGRASGRTTRASTTRIPTTTRCGSTWSRWPRTRPGTGSGRSSSTTCASRATARSRRRSIRGEYCSKADAIAGFLAYARERLEKLGVWVSADVFGIDHRHVKNDQGIGQKFEKIGQNVDIICPMVYPSHYDAGSYGIDSPTPVPTSWSPRAMKRRPTERLAGTGAMGRPWLQDFSLRGVTYGVDEVKAQIKAAEEQGFTEWILWDPSLKYTEGALRSEGG